MPRSSRSVGCDCGAGSMEDPREGLLLRPGGKPPSPHSHEGPDRLHQAERPSPLKEPVNRRQGASCCERQDEPPAAILQRIADQHGRDGEQAQKSEGIHACARNVH